MNKTDEQLLNNVLDNNIHEADSYNVRKNGKSIDRKTNPYIDIISKTPSAIYILGSTGHSNLHSIA